jgi:hypothetical protein
VFALLGLDHVWLRACNGLSCSTVREQTIPGGRLDLVIRYGLTALLVVEIKVTSAEDADTAKQSNYVAWLNKQPARRRKAILVCLDPQQEEYDGFRPIGWDRVAVNLRLLVRPLVLDGNLTAAAMTLAFAGAVEQNLLKLPNLAMKPSTSVLLQMPRLVKHLENAAIGVRIEE